MADEDWPTVDERGEVLPGIRHPAVVALRTGEPVRDQVIGFVRPDGEVSWLLVSANPIRDTRPGEVSRVVTTFVNITGRIEAQRSLAEAESRYRLLAENATDFVVFADLEGILRWTSPSVERMIGWSPGEVIGKSLLDFIHPDDLAKLPGRSERQNAGVLSRRLRLRFRDGSWGWFLASSKPVADDDGTLIGRVTGLQDVQSEMQARLELSQAHQRLELVLDSSRLGLWDWNIQTGELVLNERWAEIVGYQLAELSPVDISTWTKLVHPDDGAASSAAIAAHAGGASPFYDLDLRMRHREGHWVWVRDRGRIVEWDDQGRPLRMTGTHEDITELRVAARALAASEERFRVAMASAPVGMAVLDLQRRVQQVNPALCALLDRPEEWLVGRSMDEIIVESDVVMDASARRRLLDSDETSITVDHRVHRGNHTQIWVQQSISLVRGSGGEVAGYVSQFTDITEARRARHMLRDLAARDPLTELYNRREFTVLVKRLQEANAVDRLTLLFIDLDGLKQVNDTYGHLVGDEVIQEQSQRLLAVVRASDLVARFGGDEFVVMAVDLVGDREVADFARRIHEATRQPIRIGDDLLEVTCSIGVATMDADTDLEELLARADAALYDAKRGGRDRVAVANLPPL